MASTSIEGEGVITPSPCCESCGAPRGVPHRDGCTAAVSTHDGEAVLEVEVNS